jgi:hypothetical protein
MDPTQQVQKKKEEYWKAKTIQNLANPNWGSDPTARIDIKNALDPNLGDIIPKFFGVGCCYSFSGSLEPYENPPAGSPPSAVPTLDASLIP